MGSHAVDQDNRAKDTATITVFKSEHQVGGTWVRSGVVSAISLFQRKDDIDV